MDCDLGSKPFSNTRTMRLMPTVSPLETKAAFPSTDLTNQLSPYYVSREGLTQELDRMLVQGEQAQEGPKIVLVYGQAGFGKTQLVRDFARKQLKYGSAFRWLDASDVGKLKKSLLDIAEEAGLIPERFAVEPKDSWSEKSIRETLRFIGEIQQKWLLIYDNFDVSENESTLLRNFFPSGSHGQIIVTSRNRSVASDIDAECLHVESMTDQEAVELLGKSAKMNPRELDSQARDLQRQIAAGLLGSHPLAIAQAGAYIRNLISSSTLGAEERLREYIMRFTAREAEMLNAQNGSLVREYGRSIIASWDLSFRNVLDKNPVAARLFLFLGFLHHTNIPQDLFARAHDSKREIQTQDGVILEDKPYSWMQDVLVDEHGHSGEWDASNLRHCMGILESYSLIRITKGPQYSIHPLVHAWTRLGNIASAEDLEANAHLALVFLSRVGIVDYQRSPRGKAVHLKFISHLESCIRFAQKQTTLLELRGAQPQPKLRSRCLLELHRLLDGQALNWEMKVQQLRANLAVLATVSGSVHDGLDCPSTLKAICLLLKYIRIYNSCADVVAELSAVMLSLTPSLPTRDERGNRAEAHLEFLHLITSALMHTATPDEFDDAEIQALKWADDHRGEMNPGFYLSRKVYIMNFGVLAGFNLAERLLRLTEFLVELEAELGEESTLTWIIRCAIGRCLMKTGKKAEAVSIFKGILDQCPTLESDMGFVVKAASYALGTVFTGDKSYRDLLNIHRSLKEINAAELGPYHMDTLQEKNSELSYESKLLPYEQSHEFPYMIGFNSIFLSTDQNACLEQGDITILESALSCKASGRESEIGPLWDGIVDQSKLLPSTESLFQSFTLALETAAAAGDRQGYHSISSGLRKGSETLRARMLTHGGRESKFEELKRLRNLWYRLTTLHEAADASSNSGDASRIASMAESIYSDVGNAPVRAQPTMVWLVTNYIMWLFQLKPFRKTSPVSPSFLENFRKMNLKYFGAESIMTYRIMGTLTLCYRMVGREEPAIRLEDEITKQRIREGIEVSRGVTYRRLKAAWTMETLVNAYKRREWYTETVRLFEIVIEAFKKHFGIAAEETMVYVRFAIELYGRLEMDEKIDEVLETMLPVFQEGGDEQQQRLTDQITSVVKRCSNTKQDAAAHRVLLWLTTNGNLNIASKIVCLRDLEIFAGRLGKDDLVRKYSEERAACERQTADLEQSNA